MKIPLTAYIVTTVKRESVIIYPCLCILNYSGILASDYVIFSLRGNN